MLERIQNAVKSAFDPLQEAVQAKLPAEEINRCHEVSLSSFLNYIWLIIVRGFKNNI